MNGRGILATALLLPLVVSCGEKITVPEQQGFPDGYIETERWQLEDPIDVAEGNGRIHVLEKAPGRLTKFRTNQEVDRVVDGLVAPTALAIPTRPRRILVTEDDGTGAPAIALFALNDMAPLGRVELTGIARSAAGVAADSAYVYLSDPDSGVVHRLRWTDEASGWMQPHGIVCTNQGSVESPQFVQEPRGLAIDSMGFLLICDADTTRNWVVRFDPAPQGGDPMGLGSATIFRSIACSNTETPPQSFVLGDAPECEDDFEPDPSRTLGRLASPNGVTIDAAGRIYVADRLNGRVQRFNEDGTFNFVFGDGSAGSERLGDPLRLTTWRGITNVLNNTIDIPGARVYVVERDTAEIVVYEDTRWIGFQG